MMREYAAQSLERGIETQKRQDALALAGALQEAGFAKEGIARERASWESGGWRAESHKLQGAYNLAAANLREGQLDKAIEYAEPSWLDYTAGVFGGASSGLSLASGMYDLDQHTGFSGKLEDFFKKKKGA
jgi:hypothetical protein